MFNIKGKNHRGFTLIELLVVIAIIGILAATVLVSLNSARQKSRDARRLADVRQIMTALELYYNDNSAYPDDADSDGIPDPDSGDPRFDTFLQIYPSAPTPEDGTCTAAENAYTFTAVGNSDYTIDYCIGAATGGFTAGVHQATHGGMQ